MPTAIAPDGVHLDFDVAGEGDDVLLVPGIGLSRACWSGVRGRFVDAGYRTIGYDPRGSGQSEKPDRPYTAEDVADDAAAVLSAAGAEQAHVVGLSMGGMIAQDLAIHHPQLVRSLVLTSTYGRVDGWSRRIFELRRELIEEMGLEVAFRMSFLFVFSPYAFRDSPEVIEQIEQSVAAVDRAAFLRQLQFCLDHDALDRIGSFEAPTLVVCGEFDLLTSAIQNRELAAAVPGARLVAVPRASHGLLWERPAEYADEVVGFLDAVRTGRIGSAARA